MTKNGAKGDYMGERLLARIYTQAQLDGMNQEQFDEAKSAEKQRIIIRWSRTGASRRKPWPIARARDRIALGGGMMLLLVLGWLLVVLSASLIT